MKNESMCAWCKQVIHEEPEVSGGYTFHEECLHALESTWGKEAWRIHDRDLSRFKRDDGTVYLKELPIAVVMGPRIGVRGSCKLMPEQKRPPGSTLFGIAELPPELTEISEK